MSTFSLSEILKTASAEKTELLQRFSEAIKSDGFATAWSTHLKDLVQLFTKNGAAKDASILASDLYAVMRESSELDNYFKSLPGEVIQKIEASFGMKDGVPKWDSFLHSEFYQAVTKLYKENVSEWSEVREADGSAMKVLMNTAFQNWGRTVENVPTYTCFPTSKVGVQNIVRFAAANKKRVRVAGYRHTWGDLYSADDEILISTLTLEVATHLPAIHPPINPKNDLQGITMVGTIVENGSTKGLCKIGAATTNEQFRQWATGEGGGTPGGWTVPLNVIMVEITYGGSNAPICHGAGLQHKTLSDLVYEIEYVDANGILQTVSDPDQLKAASGCFGLLGVVTSVTLKLDKMTYASMRPYKERVALTIPPPAGFPIPTKVDMSGISQSDLQNAMDRFIDHAENDYYAEWFWFAFQESCWVNCWKNDGNSADSKPYPSKLDTFIQEGQEYLAQLMTETSWFLSLSPEIQTIIMAGGAMVFLPDIKENEPPIVAPLIDALHFRRGIQNLRVYDMEWEIPIPGTAADPTKPDWSVCQKAWWAVLQSFYARYNQNPDDVPMRLTMEMRIMGASDVVMAPQEGNNFGTCSIEVLTILTTPKEDWQDFLQQITNFWNSYKDANNEPLNARPHWAKQWAGLKVRDMDIVDYLKDVAYKDKLPQFKQILGSIASEQGFTLQEMQERFSNPLIDNLFGSVFE